MAAKTQQFKSAGSNLGRTIGQSLSMITGKDIPNYSLLFLDESLTRKRGEHETIFMPHIVLGRSSRCHVRYSDEHRTVSREHASITVDGSSFILNHNTAASNPTYVNGRTIGGSHALQNGDEIQLSSNGPKIRFNASTLKTSTIGLTSRIGQAMSQAVKPYKTALWVMGLVLLGALGLAGYNMYQNNQLKTELITLNDSKIQVDQEIADLIAKGEENSQEMAELRKRKAQIIYRTNIIREKAPDIVMPTPEDGKPKPVIGDSGDKPIPSSICQDEVELNKILPKDDVVLLVLKRIDVSYKGESGFIGVADFYKYTTNNPNAQDREGISYGTAFVTDNSKIVSARHVLQPWRYYHMEKDLKIKEFWQTINAIEYNGGVITANFDILTSKGNGEQITFNKGNISHDNDDIADNSNDKKQKKFTSKDIFPSNQKIKMADVPNKTRVAKNNESDWVSLDYNILGTIKMGKTKSQNLSSGQTLYVLGYSHTIGAMDISKWVEPTYSTTTVSNDGTSNKLIAVSGQNFGPGNSGGPAFICENGVITCIGVVVMAVGTSNAYIVPVGQIRG